VNYRWYKGEEGGEGICIFPFAEHTLARTHTHARTQLKGLVPGRGPSLSLVLEGLLRARMPEGGRSSPRSNRSRHPSAQTSIPRSRRRRWWWWWWWSPPLTRARRCRLAVLARGVIHLLVLGGLTAPAGPSETPSATLVVSVPTNALGDQITSASAAADGRSFGGTVPVGQALVRRGHGLERRRAAPRLVPGACDEAREHTHKKKNPRAESSGPSGLCRMVSRLLFKLSTPRQRGGTRTGARRGSAEGLLKLPRGEVPGHLQCSIPAHDSHNVTGHNAGHGAQQKREYEARTK